MVEFRQQPIATVTVKEVPPTTIIHKQTLLLPPVFINLLLLANGFSHLLLADGDSKLKIVG